MPHHANIRRGLTLVELLVVISILMLVMLMMTMLAGSLKSGPPLDQAVAGVRAMAARVRQLSSTQRVHGEIVLDYKNDRVVALARQPHVAFAFEDAPGSKQAAGSNGILGEYDGGATTVNSRQFHLRDGACCELPSNSATFRIPWLAQYEVEGDYEGAGLSFDFFPMGTAPGRLVDFGSTFTLSVSEYTGGACRLSLTCSGETVTAKTLCLAYRWATVEIAVSRYGIRLYVDGRLDEFVPRRDFRVMQASGSAVSFSGFPCRLDNVQYFSLISSQELEIGPNVQMVPEGVWADLELNGEAEDIFDVDAKKDPKSTNPNAVPDMSLNREGLPDTRPPAIRHVFFDDSGKLDAAIHGGAVFLALVTRGANGPERVLVIFHPLGAVTSEAVDRFPWEPDPEAAPKAPAQPPSNSGGGK
ncbi:MAG: hypothetical protein BroJett014_28840 [Planctomycetota bacterium]|nr:hypothetical protein [Planctomycetota bacterium]GIK53911.1 MAG: hypothetical protein BroJett014_28840 [Planctomycetota bacterium]